MEKSQRQEHFGRTLGNSRVCERQRGSCGYSCPGKREPLVQRGARDLDGAGRGTEPWPRAVCPHLSGRVVTQLRDGTVEARGTAAVPREMCSHGALRRAGYTSDDVISCLHEGWDGGLYFETWMVGDSGSTTLEDRRRGI